MGTNSSSTLQLCLQSSLLCCCSSTAAASQSASPKPSRFVGGSARAVKASTTSGLKKPTAALLRPGRLHRKNCQGTDKCWSSSQLPSASGICNSSPKSSPRVCRAAARSHSCMSAREALCKVRIFRGGSRGGCCKNSLLKDCKPGCKSTFTSSALPCQTDSGTTPSLP